MASQSRLGLQPREAIRFYVIPVQTALANLQSNTLEYEMNEWQPINTAPRDGTPVDLWHKNGFRIVSTWWTDDQCWSCFMDDYDFTHWMPIPSPPGFSTQKADSKIMAHGTG